MACKMGRPPEVLCKLREELESTKAERARELPAAVRVKRACEALKKSDKAVQRNQKQLQENEEKKKQILEQMQACEEDAIQLQEEHRRLQDEKSLREVEKVQAEQIQAQGQEQAHHTSDAVDLELGKDEQDDAEIQQVLENLRQFRQRKRHERERCASSMETSENYAWIDPDALLASHGIDPAMAQSCPSLLAQARDFADQLNAAHAGRHPHNGQVDMASGPEARRPRQNSRSRSPPAAAKSNG